MAKFIHLSLLLAATAQLPVVSVTKIFFKERRTVTFKFPSNWTVEYGCRDNRCKFVDDNFRFWGVKMTNSDLTIFTHYHNFVRNGNYCFYGDSNPPIHTDLLLCLKITGCAKWITRSNCRVEFSDRQPRTEDDCKRICDGDPTFKLINNECHLYVTSGTDMEIQLKNHCLINSNSENDGENAADLQFSWEAKSWIDALEHCQNQNSSLVQITNQTVQDKVNSLLNKRNSMQKGAWIGLERSIFGRSDVPWKWISGSVVGQHQPWNASFPVNILNHHCGKIIWVEELEQFKWLDACCHEELPFICQTAPT